MRIAAQRRSNRADPIQLRFVTKRPDRVPVKPWDTVAIVGVGLIGGSIGLALRQRGLARHVIGVGRRESSLQRARDVEAVTATTTHIAQGVADAEVIVVCTPVAKIVGHVREIAAHCPARCLITDVGSTKQQIVAELQENHTEHGEFIGSHPLAGSEKTGVQHADADLFERPCHDCDPVGTFDDWSRPADHRILAILGFGGVEHVPRIARCGGQLDQSRNSYHCLCPCRNHRRAELPLAATGWLDTTRVAAGDPELWQQILLSNRDHVLKSLDKFAKVLTKFRVALDQNDMDQVLELLECRKKNS